MSSTITANEFVMQLFEAIAYQADDHKAAQALESEIHPDFDAMINEIHLTREAFIKSFMTARTRETFKLVKSEELLASPANKDGDIESIAHLQTFEAKPKDQGKQSYQVQSLTVSLLKKLNGKAQLLKLNEVTKSI